jgi:DnaJ-class molecular chaperone
MSDSPEREAAQQDGMTAAQPGADTQAMTPGDEAPPGTESSGETLCRTCGGSGQVDGRDCTDCGGTGKTTSAVSAGA